MLNRTKALSSTHTPPRVPIKIEKKRILVVEGRGDKALLNAMLKKIWVFLDQLCES